MKGYGQLIAIGSDDGALEVFEVRTGKVVASAKLEPRITAMAFSRDGRLVSAGDEDGTVLVFEARGGNVAGRLKVHGPVHQVDFSRDGEKLAASSGDAISVFEARGGKQPEPLRQESVVGEVVAFGVDAGVIATGCEDGTVRVSQDGRGSW